RQALCGASTIPEQPFEDDAWVRLGGIRRRWIAPRYGVDVKAIARITRALRWKVHREFERRQLGPFADLFRSDLIRCGRQPHFDAGWRTIIRVNAGHAGRRRVGMFGGAVPESVRVRVRQSAEHGQLALQWLQRVENGWQIESGTDSGGFPLILNNAVGHI